MYEPLLSFDKKEYIESNTGNKICKSSTILTPQALEIPHGRCIIKANVTLRTDLAPLKLDKYVYIDEETSVIPPAVANADMLAKRYIPMSIGSYSYIGRFCTVEASSIGLGCYISDNCILSSRCILKDYVKVEPGTVIPADAVIPPFVIIRGDPYQVIGELPESVTSTTSIDAERRYDHFVTL